MNLNQIASIYRKQQEYLAAWAESLKANSSALPLGATGRSAEGRAKFGRLTPTGNTIACKRSKAECVCDCGTFVFIRIDQLKSQAAQSCGCLRNDIIKSANLTHGETGKKEYRIWRGMHQRCKNKNYPQYKDYGGRGIGVCESWKSYQQFLADMGRCPYGMSLDRIDNNSGYCKENCRWATRKQQSSNMRTNVFIEFNGNRLCLQEWARRIGIHPSALRKRLRKYPKETALTKKKNHKCANYGADNFHKKPKIFALHP